MTEPLASLKSPFERLQNLAELSPNWDSYGADAPTVKAIAKAYSIIALVAEAFADRIDSPALPWAIVPLADGGVQLEWRGRGQTIEIEVGPDGSMGYLIENMQENEVDYVQGDNISGDDVLDLIATVLDL